MDSKETNTDTFIHSGVISKINGSSIIVALDPNVHCESCRAKGVCGVSDSVSKEVEVTQIDRSFKLHEPVDVVLKKNLGQKAVLWAYGFPFVLMLLTLFITSLIFEEWIAGLLSLFILIPYYVLLHVFNNYFRKTFKVSILKLDNA